MNLTLIPSGFVLFRFLISPFLLLDALDGKTSVWFIVGFVAAFLIFHALNIRQELVTPITK
ncbi:hypothetical protein [Nostoc sp. C117]|uniref:hypothetical protein n=1 Tax=Nostoc sp. C117 TaxID=3349875 RepID=UPI00370D9B55